MRDANFPGRSSDSESTAANAFPDISSGNLLGHHPYSVGHVAESHRFPDSPITMRCGHLKADMIHEGKASVKAGLQSASLVNTAPNAAIM